MTEPARPLNLLGQLVQGSRAAKSVKGKKTYIIGALMVAYGVYAFITGEIPTYANPQPMSPDAAVQMILEGLGFGTVRAGVAKIGNGS